MKFHRIIKNQVEHYRKHLINVLIQCFLFQFYSIFYLFILFIQISYVDDILTLYCMARWAGHATGRAGQCRGRCTDSWSVFDLREPWYTYSVMQSDLYSSKSDTFHELLWTRRLNKLWTNNNFCRTRVGRVEISELGWDH